MSAQEYEAGFVKGEQMQFERGVTYALAEVSRYLAGEHQDDCLCSICAVFRAHGWEILQETEPTPVPHVFVDAFTPPMEEPCKVFDCPLPVRADSDLCADCLDSSDG